MPDLAETFNARSVGTLPGLLGLHVVAIERGRAQAEIAVAGRHMAPNGYLHAGTVVTLADTCCGYGCVASLPDGASSFTTIELKSNHLGTARDGTIECHATLFHGGRTTQVWDAVVTHRESGRTLALFRCTQMVLYPKAAA
jgi:uncharacterized protein (TIGR00369 family)